MKLESRNEILGWLPHLSIRKGTRLASKQHRDRGPSHGASFPIEALVNGRAASHWMPILRRSNVSALDRRRMVSRATTACRRRHPAFQPQISPLAAVFHIWKLPEKGRLLL
jgi:hypothetical protein